MTPAVVDLAVHQGDEFNQPLRFRGETAGTYLDLTGYTFRAQIRQTPSDTTAVATFTVTVAAPQSGDTKGRIDLNLDDSVTDDLPVRVLRYDLEVTPPGGEPSTWVKGTVRVTGQVTR